MKKTSLIYFVLFLLITTFTFACKKDEPQQEDIFAGSVWIGKTNNPLKHYNGIYYYSISFNTNKQFFIGTCDSAGVVTKTIESGTYSLENYPYIDLHYEGGGKIKMTYSEQRGYIQSLYYGINFVRQ